MHLKRYLFPALECYSLLNENVDSMHCLGLLLYCSFEILAYKEKSDFQKIQTIKFFLCLGIVGD